MTDQYLYHRPVLLQASINGLITRTEGIYVDVTFGGGGHSTEILQRINGEGRLIALDQDEEAEAESAKITNRSFTFCRANFRFLKRYLKMLGVTQVDGIIADLGISSHQIDTPERGFSTRFDHQLDMRMDNDSSLTAEMIINQYDEGELVKILGMYGEVRNARTLASAIVRNRLKAQIKTIAQLKEILSPLAQRGKENRYYAQVFQAFRIAVNDEMGALKEFLEQSSEILSERGRLVIISYHSLEDRLVKNYMKTGSVDGRLEKDFYGNILRPLKPINNKPISPDEGEIDINKRARSAKLRIAEKI